MVVIYLDGVDGAGKTTLTNRLAENIPQAVIAPPLWRYLASVTAPEDFAAWVTTTAPEGVAIELLAAQRGRIADVNTAVRDAEASAMLVDRGPKTVAASARAHLHGSVARDGGRALERSFVYLQWAVRRLAQTHPCISIELATNNYGEIVGRLTDTERRNVSYRQYLERFLTEFQTARHTDGVISLMLLANDTVDHNLHTATRVVRSLPVD
jgi:predicted ATPase